MMREKAVGDFIKSFEKMNRAVIRGIKAPHKPLLLLAVLHLVQRHVITCNHIVLSDELMREFKLLWMQYVGDTDENTSVQVAEGLTLDLALRYPFKCSIVNPFYHLQHESFWRLVKSADFVERKDYTSIKMLRTCFAYAEIDEELFLLMMDKEMGDVIADNLVKLVVG